MTSKIASQAAVALLGVCLTFAAGPAPATAQQELRIGLLSPITGFQSQTGQDMTHGFQLYLDQHTDILGGAKVNLIVEDTTGKPDEAVAKAKRRALS